MQLQWGINIYLQINMIMSEWVKIYGECWTIFIVFRMEKTPQNMFILFTFHVHECLRVERKHTKFKANAALMKVW